jgi:hypothetical protein
MVNPNTTYRLARKTADQSMTQSNTVQENITSLKVALAKNRIYKFVATVMILGKAVQGCDLNLKALAGAVFTYGLSSVTPKVSTGAADIAITLTDDVLSVAVIEGIINVGATAGDLQITGAQTVSGATALTIKGGSTLEAWLVSDSP